MILNENVSVLPESGLSVKKRIEDFLSSHPSRTLLRLDQSLMNMPLPDFVIRGMLGAVEETAAPEGRRLSSPWSGYDTLKKAVSAHLERFSVKIPESEIFIVSGLESARSCLLHLFSDGRNVILPSPCESRLRELCQSAGSYVSFLRATPENDFSPEPDGTPAELVFLNSPDAVTGAALTRETLTKWVRFANENGSVLFYDASFSEYITGEDHPRSIYEIEGARDCAIEIFSFEKGYGVKELKVAYAIIPSSLIRENMRLRDLFCARQPSTATPPSYVMQRAAELLLAPENREEVERMISRIKKVAVTLSRGLTRAGIPHTGGESSPFLWAQCPEGINSWQCFDLLLEKAGCVVTPGSLFGFGGEGFFRMTSFGLPEEAEEAAERFSLAFRPEKEPEERKEDPASPVFSEEPDAP